jgi:hypothetical protein
MVFALIAMLFHSRGEHLLCFFDLHPDLRQVGQLHGRAILIDQGFQIQPVKMKIAVLYIEPFLWKIESLFHQVGVRVVHVLVQVADSREFKWSVKWFTRNTENECKSNRLISFSNKKNRARSFS